MDRWMQVHTLCSLNCGLYAFIMLCCELCCEKKLRMSECMSPGRSRTHRRARRAVREVRVVVLEVVCRVDLDALVAAVDLAQLLARVEKHQQRVRVHCVRQ